MDRSARGSAYASEAQFEAWASAEVCHQLTCVTRGSHGKEVGQTLESRHSKSCVNTCIHPAGLFSIPSQKKSKAA